VHCTERNLALLPSNLCLMMRHIDQRDAPFACDEKTIFRLNLPRFDSDLYSNNTIPLKIQIETLKIQSIV
jgi:hypothetical protein